MRRLFTPTMTWCLLALATITKAQTAGTIDATFNPDDKGYNSGYGASGDINTMVVQSDGKIIIGGAFVSYNGKTKNKIARLNADGSIDDTFTSTEANTNDVTALSLQPDDKIIVGGRISRFARLNATGSVDASFVTGSGITSPGAGVSATLVQSDGKIVVSGVINTYNATVINNFLFRVNSNGTLYDQVSFNGYTTALVEQSDGKILIGAGNNGLTRLNTDGTVDATFNIGTGVNGIINYIAVQGDGKILITGNFTDYNGITVNGLARLNDDGTLDTSFNVGTGFDIANLGLGYSIVIQANGQIIVGGSFHSYNSTAVNLIVRLNTDGSLDPSFVAGNGANGTLKSIALTSDEQVLIAGSFTTIEGLVLNRIARLNTDGSVDDTFNPSTGVNNTVRSLAIQNDGKIIIGGDFLFYEGNSTSRIARLNPDGSIDQAFTTAGNPGANNTVNTITVQSDGKIIIGGTFTSYKGVACRRIARLNTNGGLDLTFSTGSGANAGVNATALQGTKIIVGGSFNIFNGNNTKNLARLNANGSYDATFAIGNSTNNNINAIAVQSDQKIIIAGDFTSFDGATTNSIARLNADGTLDLAFTFAGGSGANNKIYALAIQSDGKILIGGQFTSFNGTSRNYIARLNDDGSLDASFNVGTGADNIVRTIVVQSNGKIILGGQFLTYNGTTVSRTVRLNTDGSIDQTFTGGSRADNNVFTAALQSDGKLIIGGDFTSYNTTGRNRIARINTCSFPEIPSLTYSIAAVCSGDGTTISIASGNLNDATTWQWYSGSCGGTSVGNGTNVPVFPTTTTTYYARGEGGCVTPDACANITITVNTLDLNVSTNGLTLTAAQAGAVYQWIDCTNGNQDIANETSQTFVAPQAGSYAVRITNGACSGTSACKSVVVTALNGSKYDEVSMYPNPASNSISVTGITGVTTIYIYDQFGKLVKEQTVDMDATVNTSMLETGMYNVVTERAALRVYSKLVIIR